MSAMSLHMVCFLLSSQTSTLRACAGGQPIPAFLPNVPASYGKETYMHTPKAWLSQAWRARIGGYVILVLSSSFGAWVIITAPHFVGTFQQSATTTNAPF